MYRGTTGEEWPFHSKPRPQGQNVQWPGFNNCAKARLVYPIIDACQSKCQPETLTIPASSKR